MPRYRARVDLGSQTTGEYVARWTSRSRTTRGHDGIGDRSRQSIRAHQGEAGARGVGPFDLFPGLPAPVWPTVVA